MDAVWVRLRAGVTRNLRARCHRSRVGVAAMAGGHWCGSKWHAWGETGGQGAQGGERCAVLMLLCETVWPEMLALMPEQTVWVCPVRSLVPCSGSGCMPETLFLPWHKCHQANRSWALWRRRVRAALLHDTSSNLCFVTPTCEFTAHTSIVSLLDTRCEAYRSARL